MLAIPRPPRTDDELWWLIKAMWGVELPRVAVCADHMSPFDAVAHAYFGRAPNFAVWYASRGSGKSLALAVLGLVKAFVLDIDVTILGGSMTQSKNVAEHMARLLAHANAPLYAMEKRTVTEIRLHTQKTIRPLPASQTTVRGPHPPLTLLDEVDEMDPAIYNASLGQAMEQENIHGTSIEEYIVASSTWQNPEGTFSEVIEKAREEGTPVFTWCWRELLAPYGWMTQRFIDNKRKAVSSQMWHVEYELNEPTAGSRAFDLDKVAEYFLDPLDYPALVAEKHQDDHDVWVWQKPDPTGIYAVGADWAKEKDKTVIVVVRYDVAPHRLVKMTRINRRPWDFMIDLFNADVQAYGAVGEHDGTGIGNVVHDFIDFSDTTNKFVMVGRKRTELLLDYITEFEHGRYRLPHLVSGETESQVGSKDVLFRAHRATTVADVYAPGKWDSHLPDEVAAMALCNKAIKSMPVPVKDLPMIPKDDRPREIDRQFHVQPVDAGVVALVTDGGVALVDEDYGLAPGELWIPSDGSRDGWGAHSV